MASTEEKEAYTEFC